MIANVYKKTNNSIFTLILSQVIAQEKNQKQRSSSLITLK